MIWFAHTPDNKLYINAERWFDARAYALIKLGENAVVEVSVSQTIVPDARLEWVGHDNGDKPNRRLVVKRRAA